MLLFQSLQDKNMITTCFYKYVDCMAAWDRRINLQWDEKMDNCCQAEDADWVKKCGELWV